MLNDGADESNDKGLVQGQLDIPLNNHGRNQIERLAKHCELVPFNRIYTSNLSRAVEVCLLPYTWYERVVADRQTAEIIAKHPAHGDLVISHELRDRHYGSLEGELWDGGDIVPEDAETQES